MCLVTGRRCLTRPAVPKTVPDWFDAVTSAAVRCDRHRKCSASDARRAPVSVALDSAKERHESTHAAIDDSRPVPCCDAMAGTPRPCRNADRIGRFAARKRGWVERNSGMRAADPRRIQAQPADCCWPSLARSQPSVYCCSVRALVEKGDSLPSGAVALHRCRVAGSCLEPLPIKPAPFDRIFSLGFAHTTLC